MTNAHITLFIRSKKVAKDTKIIRTPVFVAGTTQMSESAKRVVIYENVLDADQKAMLENSKALAQNLRVTLVVKDLAKLNLIERLLGLISRRKINSPFLSLDENAISVLISQPRVNIGVVNK